MSLPQFSIVENANQPFLKVFDSRGNEYLSPLLHSNNCNPIYATNSFAPWTVTHQPSNDSLLGDSAGSLIRPRVADVGVRLPSSQNNGVFLNPNGTSYITSGNFELRGDAQSTSTFTARRFNTPQFGTSGGAAITQVQSASLAHGSILLAGTTTGSETPESVSVLNASWQGSDTCRLNYAGDLSVNSITFGTASNDVVIDTSSAGSWTPGLSIGGTAHTVSSSNGYYRRIGDMVLLTGNIVVGTIGASTGTVALTGIPAGIAPKDVTGSTIDFSGGIFTNLRPTAYAEKKYFLMFNGSTDDVELYVDSISDAKLTDAASEAAIQQNMELRFTLNYICE